MNDALDLSNPFPGLRSFSAAESDRFFGRRDQVSEVLRRLHRHRFLAVIGASGSGKSSLIRAGVIPALGGRLRTRSGTDWRVAIMTPGNGPVGRLAEALAAPHALGDADLEPALRRTLLETTLRRGALGLIQAVQESRIGTNLLLLVDQFEELFRVRPLAGESQDQAAAFVRLFLEANVQQEVPIYVVLTMRSDFLGDCVRFPGLPDAINRGLYLVPSLTREQRSEVITGPIRLRGGQIAPRLLHRLLNDVGEDSSQLTSLQHALMRTWAYWRAHREGDEPLDLSHYQAIGTLEHALERHASEAWEELREEHERRIAESIFKRLTEKGPDRREIRHPTTLGDLCAIAERSADAILPVLGVFRRMDRCFVLPGPQTPLEKDSVVDIAHESLIRVWRQLRQWVEEETQSAEEYRRLVERMTRYRAGKDTYLHNPALRLALDWRERNHPNRAWAERYDGRFDDAMAFLDQSEAAHRRAESEKEAAHQHELEQARALAAEKELRFQEQRLAVRRLRLFALALLVVFTGAVAAAIDSWWASRQAAYEARQSMARGQAMAAVNNLDVDPERSVLLGLQAVATTYRVDGEVTPVASSALNRAVQAAAARPVLDGHTRGVLALAFAGGSERLVSAGRDGQVLLWDPAARQVTARQRFPGAKLYALAVSTDGARLAAAGESGSIYLWPSSAQAPRSLIGHAGGVSALAFSPDGQLLASAGWDGTVRVWDAGTGAPIHSLEGHRGRVSALAFRPDGKRLASAGWDGTVRLWDPGDGAPKGLLEGHAGELMALAYSADGSRLASAGWDSQVRLWDGRSGVPVAILRGHKDAVLALAFSPDSRWLASGGRDAQVQVWNAENGQLRHTLAWHTGNIVALAYAPAGALLASAGADGLGLWNPATGRHSTALCEHRGWVNALAFSSDGRLLASGGDDGRIIVCHLNRAEPDLPPLAGFEPWRVRYAVSPDGKRIAYLDDGAVKILDPARGRILLVLSGTDPGSYRLAFSKDSRRVATAAENGQVRVFYLDTRELVGQARGLVTRGLTPEECQTFLFRDDCPPVPFPGAADHPQPP